MERVQLRTKKELLEKSLKLNNKRTLYENNSHLAISNNT